MNCKRHKTIQGFTLIEILLVVAAIAILAGIVILAINPGKQLAETRNAQRKADVNTILNAVYQYSLDQGGLVPATIPTGSGGEICKTGVTCTAPDVDLSALTNNGLYLVSLPIDPTPDPNAARATITTRYVIMRNGNGRITVSAPAAEEGKTISVTR